MVTPPSPSDLLPAMAAALELGTTELNILMHLKRGLLTGTEIDGAWYVSRASLIALQGRDDLPAAASLCKTGCAKVGGCGGCA